MKFFCFCNEKMCSGDCDATGTLKTSVHIGHFLFRLWQPWTNCYQTRLRAVYSNFQKVERHIFHLLNAPLTMMAHGGTMYFSTIKSCVALSLSFIASRPHIHTSTRRTAVLSCTVSKDKHQACGNIRPFGSSSRTALKKKVSPTCFVSLFLFKKNMLSSCG